MNVAQLSHSITRPTLWEDAIFCCIYMDARASERSTCMICLPICQCPHHPQSCPHEETSSPFEGRLARDNVKPFSRHKRRHSQQQTGGDACACVCVCFFFFSLTSTFQLLGQAVITRVSSLLLPGSCLPFLSRIRFSNPTARRFFIECCSLPGIR